MLSASSLWNERSLTREPEGGTLSLPEPCECPGPESVLIFFCVPCQLPAYTRLATPGLRYPLQRILILFARVPNAFSLNCPAHPRSSPATSGSQVELQEVSFPSRALCVQGGPAVSPEWLLSPCSVTLGGLTGPSWVGARKEQLPKQVAIVTESPPLHSSH